MGELHEGDWEYTNCDEYSEMYRIVELLYCTSETNITPYIIYTGILFYFILFYFIFYTGILKIKT